MNVSLWQSGVLEQGAFFAVPISQRCCEDKNARRNVRRFPMKPHAFQPLFLQLSTSRQNPTASMLHIGRRRMSRRWADINEI